MKKLIIFLFPLLLHAQNQINASKQLQSVTGSGAQVLATSPTLVTPNIDAATASSLIDTGAASLTGEYCLHTDSTGVFSNAGAACGSTSGSVVATPSYLMNDYIVTSTSTYHATGLSLPILPASTIGIGECYIYESGANISLPHNYGFNLSAAPLYGIVYGITTFNALAGSSIGTSALVSASGTTLVYNSNSSFYKINPILYFVVASTTNPVAIALYAYGGGTAMTFYKWSHCEWIAYKAE